MKKEVSICMIVKNEEKDLKRCLDSFLPILHEKWCELVIVDTGSKDRTLDVAKEYTKKVFVKKFIPWNFSKARNYGIAKATGRRILVVDADEELKQESVNILKKVLLEAKEPTIFVRVLSYYTADKLQFSEVIQSRIFNNGDIHYERSIHNKPESSTPYLFSTDITLNHYGYLFQGKEELYNKKLDRSLPMLVEEYNKDPKDMHILTHLIKTYWMANDYDKVIELGNTWMKIFSTVGYHDGWSAYLEVFVNLVGAYISRGDEDNAERVRKESLKYSDQILTIDIIIGNYYSNKNPKKARKYFERVILKGRAERGLYNELLTSNVRMMIPEILNYLAIMCMEEGDFIRAGEYVNDGIMMNQNRLPLRWDLFNEPGVIKRLKEYAIKRTG